MKLIKDLGLLPSHRDPTMKHSYAIFQCASCSKTFKRIKAEEKYRKDNDDCRSCLMRKKKTTHGLSGTRIDTCYGNMMSRCYSKKATHYENYGGRGITVCEEWKDDKNSFFKWAFSNGYSPNLEIDRKKPDNNYSPATCRWVTETIQSQNVRIRKDNSSGYKGVYFHKLVKKWAASIQINKKREILGYFKCRLAAAYAYDDYIEKHQSYHIKNFS